jgi:hypothetical protein
MKRMALATLGAAVFAAGLSAPASAGIHISIPVEIIATDTPVYYEGHAAYWYGDRWYYRVGREWYEYRTEPVYLRDYRSNHARERRFYGRQHDRVERQERWEERRHEERRDERRDREERRDRRDDRRDHRPD